MNDKYEFFYGGPFSQWYKHKFKVDGVEYNTAEQYMMAMKAHYFGDTEIEKRILATNDPSEQKALGRQVEGFDKEAWDAVSRGFVYKGNMAKFTSDPGLQSILLATGDKELVEASPFDTIWGIGIGMKDPKRLDKANWRGTNWLGETLMKVRNDIIRKAEPSTLEKIEIQVIYKGKVYRSTNSVETPADPEQAIKLHMRNTVSLFQHIFSQIFPKL